MPAAPSSKPPTKQYVSLARNLRTTDQTPWGSIEEVVNAPLIGVTPDASWVSVIGMWLLLLLNLLQAFLGATIAPVYRHYATWSMISYNCGSPLILAFTWWRYMLTGIVALLWQGGSRLNLFLWQWRNYGSGDWFYQGEGIWCWRYTQVINILTQQQQRKSAFGCNAAPMPDIFPPSILIFLPNAPPIDPHTGLAPPDATVHESEWWAIRSGVKRHFLGPSNTGYNERMAGLKAYLRANGVKADDSKLTDENYLNGLVVRCVFYVIFGGITPAWLSDEDVSTLANWRGYALYFILPRLLQRFVFNTFSKKVKQLRVDQAHIIDRLGLRQPFIAMNKELPPEYQRTTGVELMDQVMYVIGFAGIGGTSAGLKSTASFLMGNTGEVPANLVTFPPDWDLATAKASYALSPHNFIREVCRLDPPVTSATTSLDSDTEILLYNGVGINRLPNSKKLSSFRKGTLNQYTLSMANRDPDTFTEPMLFNPAREDLDLAVTWNGIFKNTRLGADADALAEMEERKYPRLCPGRLLSIYTIEAIIDVLIGKD